MLGRLRITGVLFEEKKYGWLFYFNEITRTEISILYQLDAILTRLFEKSESFENRRPLEAKSFVKAYYQGKFNTTGGYIMDYNQIQTPTQKLAFLRSNGYLKLDEDYTDDEINNTFENVLFRRITKLETDIGRIS